MFTLPFSKIKTEFWKAIFKHILGHGIIQAIFFLIVRLFPLDNEKISFIASLMNLSPGYIIFF